MTATKFRVETDEGVMRLDFDPKAHETAEAAAKAFYEALKPLVRAAGQHIETELTLSSPEQTAQTFDGRYRSWWVIWEAGPFDWGVVASLCGLWAPKWWTEPYYGFDVMFCEDDAVLEAAAVAALEAK